MGINKRGTLYTKDASSTRNWGEMSEEKEALEKREIVKPPKTPQKTCKKNE